MSSKSDRTVDDFRREILCIPQVQECHLVSGDFDYLVKARIKEISQYRHLLGEILLRLPGVTQTKSCVVMEEVKETLRSEEHTSELQSLMRISYAVFCLKKKNNNRRRQQESRT